MLIDFQELEEKIIKNFYGGEKSTIAHLFIDEKNKIMLGKLEPQASIGLHTHQTSSEMLYVLQGEGCVLYDGNTERVKKGSCHYCPKGHEHSLINDSNDDLIFFAVVPEQ